MFFDYLLFAMVLIFPFLFWVWNNYKKSEAEAKCPNCNRLWAAVYLHQQLMGMFQKMYEPPIRLRGRIYIARFEKYKINCKCKYCGYEWIFFKSVKQ